MLNDELYAEHGSVPAVTIVANSNGTKVAIVRQLGGRRRTIVAEEIAAVAALVGSSEQAEVDTAFYAAVRRNQCRRMFHENSQCAQLGTHHRTIYHRLIK